MTLCRRDRSGHIDPQYARELLARSGRTREAPRAPRRRAAIADELAEWFVAEATASGAPSAERFDATTEEELGGPFVASSAQVEFALGFDASNPRGARPEPLPRTRGGT